jgi:hypothetical protein
VLSQNSVIEFDDSDVATVARSSLTTTYLHRELLRVLAVQRPI